MCVCDTIIYTGGKKVFCLFFLNLLLRMRCDMSPHLYSRETVVFKKHIRSNEHRWSLDTYNFNNAPPPSPAPKYVKRPMV